MEVRRFTLGAKGKPPHAIEELGPRKRGPWKGRDLLLAFNYPLARRVASDHVLSEFEGEICI